MTPRDWRISHNLTLAGMARAVGVSGTNPASTYRRWEVGHAECPLYVVVEVERLSNGVVAAADWLAVRQGARGSAGLLEKAS